MQRVLPTAPRVGTVLVELYIEPAVACGVQGLNGNGATLCSTGDNRPFAAIGSPDPKADPSRNRVLLTLDFGTGDVTVRANPSCSVPTGGGDATCHAPRQQGQGNDVNASTPTPGSTELNMQFSESSYWKPPWNTCTINEDITFTPNNQTGDLDVSGNGSTFPSIAVIHDNKVIVADEGLHLTGLCLPTRQNYDYRGTKTPVPSVPPSTGPTAVPSASSGGLTMTVMSSVRSYLVPEDQAQGLFFDRVILSVRDVSAPDQLTFDSTTFDAVDSEHIVDQTTGLSPWEDCQGIGGPGVTIVPGASLTLQPICFELHGPIASGFSIQYFGPPSVTLTVPASFGSTVNAKYPVGQDSSIYTTPSLGAASVGNVTTADDVDIVCTVSGPAVTNYQGSTSAVWDKILTLTAIEGYLPDAYINTGTSNPVASPC